MTRTKPADRKLFALVAVCGGVLILLGLLLPWITAGVGSGQSVYLGTELLASWFPTVLLGLAAISFATAWWWFGNGDWATYAAFAAGFSFLLTGLTLVVIEVSSDLIPSSFLPATLRRSSGVLTAGPGLWVSLVGAAIVLFTTSGLASTRLTSQAWNSAAGRKGIGAAALLLGFVVLVGWLRYQPWIASSVLGRELDLTGQAAPWLGPASLLAVCLLAGSLVLSALSRFQAAGLLAAGSGWLIAFLAAVAVIASESLAQLRLGDILNGSDTGHTVTFHAAIAAWATYLSGLLIAVIGGYLVCLPHRSGGG